MNSSKLLELKKNVPYWFEACEPRPALTGPIDADVAIVGAGYTGLWTAYYLLKAQPSLQIVLLEQQNVGFGASGRNGGWASAIFPISPQRVAQLSSHEAALHLQKCMNASVDEIGRVGRDEGFDFDYTKNGFLALARNRAQLTRVTNAVRDAASFGLSGQWHLLGAREASAKIGVAGVLGGMYTEHCAIIHPGKLVRGLARVVEGLGGRIYEQTNALRIAAGQVHTNNGSVRARFVVQATEAYGLQQSAQRRAMIPVYTLVLATEPLSEPQRHAFALKERMAFNDLRHMRNYGQITADGRLVFGGRGAPYRFGSRLRPDDGLIDSLHLKIHENLMEFFPGMGDVQITHRWGGPMAVARDWSPSVRFDPQTGLAQAGCYVGDGVTLSNLSGRILRNLILGTEDELNGLPLVNWHSPQWEGEPLRWIGVNAGILATSLSDVEERWTRAPSRLGILMEKMTGAH